VAEGSGCTVSVGILIAGVGVAASEEVGKGVIVADEVVGKGDGWGEGREVGGVVMVVGEAVGRSVATTVEVAAGDVGIGVVEGEIVGSGGSVAAVVIVTEAVAVSMIDVAAWVGVADDAGDGVGELSLVAVGICDAVAVGGTLSVG